MALTYSQYLKVEELLKLQQPLSQPVEHDETLFIIIHQVYELWFKLLLHEFEKIKRDFSSDDIYGAMATLKRARTVMKTLVGQLDILETMTPMSFSSFRDRLENASGFQSYQFRELEFLLGYKRPDMLVHYQSLPAAQTALQRRLQERSVVDHFYDFLKQRGAKIPSELVTRDVKLANTPHEKIQETLLTMYRHSPEAAILFELMTDFDEGFQEWRYRHVKMVERTIGRKRGTGGSEGVEFLRQSLFNPIFPDLWAMRHQL